MVLEGRGGRGDGCRTRHKLPGGKGPLLARRQGDGCQRLKSQDIKRFVPTVKRPARSRSIQTRSVRFTATIVIIRADLVRHPDR
jgi:hypothetical protein